MFLFILYAPIAVLHLRGNGSPEQRSAEAATRTAVIGALIAVGAAITAGVGFRNYLLRRETNAVELYVRAVDQLGSNVIAVRIGGVFALEGLAATRHDHLRPVVDLLATFSRTQTPEGPSSTSTLDSDVQAAISALSRLSVGPLPAPIDLRAAYLAGVDILDAELSGARMHGANLQRCRLIKARMIDAKLTSARLSNAHVRGASFDRANLSGADLERIDAHDATFDEAVLEGASLIDGWFTRASFRGANVRGSDFRGARLSACNFTDARMDRVDLRSAYLLDATLDGAELRGAKLSGARVRMGSLSQEQLRQIDDAPEILFIVPAG